MQSPEDVICLILSLIVTNIDSLGTLNILLRTSKSLRTTGLGDRRLFESVASNMPAMTKTVLRKLFVFTEHVTLPLLILPCPYSDRLVLLCRVADAFKHAMVIHGDLYGISRAYHSRQRRSLAMKQAWKKKKEDMGLIWQSRRRDIEQIHQDLCMIPSIDLIPTDAELFYMARGIIKRLGVVYRGKRVFFTLFN